MSDDPVRWTDINGRAHTTAPGTMRSFSLNSPEAYEALGGRSSRPWIPNGALPREPLWPGRESGVWVNAETDDEAQDAVREWMRHVDAGRICGGR